MNEERLAPRKVCSYCLFNHTVIPKDTVFQSATMKEKQRLISLFERRLSCETLEIALHDGRKEATPEDAKVAFDLLLKRWAL